MNWLLRRRGRPGRVDHSRFRARLDAACLCSPRLLNARLTRFAIDYSKCLFCSLCCDPCPVDCIHMGQQFDLASFARQGDGVTLDFVRGEGPWRTAVTSDDGKAGLRAHQPADDQRNGEGQ